MRKFCRSAIKRCFTTLSIKLYSWLEHRRRQHLVASSLPFNQQFVIGIECMAGRVRESNNNIASCERGRITIVESFSLLSLSVVQSNVIKHFLIQLPAFRSIKQSKNGFEPLSLIAMLSTNRFFNDSCNIIRQHFPRDSKIGGNRRGGADGLPMQLIASQAKWGVERLPAPFNMLEYLREMT